MSERESSNDTGTLWVVVLVGGVMLAHWLGEFIERHERRMRRLEQRAGITVPSEDRVELDGEVHP